MLSKFVTKTCFGLGKCGSCSNKFFHKIIHKFIIIENPCPPAAPTYCERIPRKTHVCTEVITSQGSFKNFNVLGLLT